MSAAAPQRHDGLRRPQSPFLRPGGDRNYQTCCSAPGSCPRFEGLPQVTCPRSLCAAAFAGGRHRRYWGRYWGLPSLQGWDGTPRPGRAFARGLFVFTPQFPCPKAPSQGTRWELSSVLSAPKANAASPGLVFRRKICHTWKQLECIFTNS